jgi:hypothetical protein
MRGNLAALYLSAANFPDDDFWLAPLKVCFQDTPGLTRQRGLKPTGVTIAAKLHP